MFRIKICGITRPAQVEGIAAAGADALGVNFYTGSSRCVAENQVADILAAMPVGMMKVGLFVNHSAAEIIERFDSLQLDLIQLHGDEPPELLSQLDGRPVLRAFRIGKHGLSPVVKFLDACRVLHCSPSMLLLDAYSSNSYGGSGRLAPWNEIVEHRDQLQELPFALAGGLTGENVGEAIELVRPAAVDTASGVESAPGVKDQNRVTRFCHEAQTAFARFA